mmetsp:Transcript_112154/g.250320  ORF Transcript_112154/g.250320 Transcript_112154/m.250320 type:complete len:104 (-) Transcript_112154:146-457(-)
MAAARRTLLPAALLALALVGALYEAGTFVNGGRPATPVTSLRGGTAQQALPAEAMALAETSVVTSLQIQTPAWWANILGVILPCTFLIVLYIQSERTKAEEGL